MRRFVVVAALVAMVAGGGGGAVFAETGTVYVAAGVAQWGETIYSGAGTYPCETEYYQLDLILALRTGGHQWKGEIRQTPFYGGGGSYVPCGSTPPSFPGEWVTGSFSNAATGAVASAAGTCAGYYGAVNLNLFCHLSFAGTPTTLSLTTLGGDAGNTGCASAGGDTGGEGCEYVAPIAGARVQQP